MATIAQKAGVARSTVSKALRDDPTIPKQRCDEIKALAESLGYRPNPMVSALMAQLHHHRRRIDPHQIAWLDLWDEGVTLPIMQPLLDGARRRAAELGYEMSVYRPIVEKINPVRLRQILGARSQWGIIIPPVPESHASYPLELRGLAAATIGTSLHSPVMHRVSPNHYQGAQIACRRLREKGFRRIALVLSPAYNERVERKWLGAYLEEQHGWPKEERVPTLLVAPEARREFDKWLAHYKPDAVLLAEQHIARWLDQAKPARLRPQSVWLHLESQSPGVWHIDYHTESIGAAATEQVIGQIHRNERGQPTLPHTLLLECSWRE